MAKKVLLISLAIFMILLFSACGEQPEDEIVPEFYTGSNVTDLDGLTVSWGFSMSRYADNVDNVFGFIPDTVFADLATERKKQIEKDLNCVISVENISNSYTIADKLNASLIAGAKLYDIATCDTSLLTNLVRGNGYLYGLSSLLDVQNTDKWGTPTMLQTMLWGNDLYAVLPFAWPELLYGTPGHVIAVNETIVSQLGQTDPREFVENNTWTWDNFEDVLAVYTHEESGRTVYGIYSHNAYWGMNMFLSNGVSYLEIEDGVVKCGAYTEAGRTALERAQSIRNQTSKDCFYPSDDADATSLFVNGDVVMYVAWHGGIMGGTDSLAYKTDNFGILPFPQGPNAVPGVYKSYYEQYAYATCIPVNCTDPQASAMVIDAMYEPFPGLETKEDIAEYMTTQVFFDIRDAEIFINTISHTEYCFFWEGGRSVFESAVSSNTPISTLLDSMQDKYDTLVEELLEPHYQGRLAVYGE